MTEEQRKHEVRLLEEMLGAPAHNRSGRNPRFSVLGWGLIAVMVWTVATVLIVRAL